MLVNCVPQLNKKGRQKIINQIEDLEDRDIVGRTNSPLAKLESFTKRHRRDKSTWTSLGETGDTNAGSGTLQCVYDISSSLRSLYKVSSVLILYAKYVGIYDDDDVKKVIFKMFYQTYNGISSHSIIKTLIPAIKFDPYRCLFISINFFLSWQISL
mgnify:CR=1 FL=1